jgi:3-oxoadipate enol-lactonase
MKCQTGHAWIFNVMTDQTRMLSMSDGVKISVDYQPSAGKPVLIFSNSLGTDRRMWSAQVEALQGKYSIVTYDTRGHGLSDVPTGAYSIDRLGLDVLEIMDFLEIEHAHLCGLSLGGMIAQHLAWRAPDRFLSLVLAATSAYMGPPSVWQERIELILAQGIGAATEAVLSRWFTGGFLNNCPEDVSAIRASLINMSSAGYTGACAAVRDMDQRNTAHLNTLPTLIISGLQDPATPSEHSEFLKSRMPHASIKFLDGAHLVNMEQPQKFTSAIHEFLGSVS